MTRLYFAYGSNMKSSRLEKRVGTVVDHGQATLKDFVIAFNKLSTDGTGKTNIMPAERKDVLGVIYEMSEDQLNVLDESEKGYLRVPMAANLQGKIIPVQTYVAIDEKINNNLQPTAEYLGYLIDGADEHGFPEEYQNFLKSFEVCK